MLKKIKNFCSSIGKKIEEKKEVLTGVVMAAGAGALATNSVHAAADADIAAGLASTTLIFTDNKSNFITYIVAVFGVIVLIVLFLAFLRWVRAQASGVFSGKRKGR